MKRHRAGNHPQQVARRGARDDIDDRGTPPDLFAQLHERFRFTIDVAAAPHNAKLPRFFTRERSGLLHPWTGERVWCNPPFSAIGPWVRKAWHERNPLTVMLVPANRTEQPWWQEHVEPYRDRCDARMFRTEFLPGRIRFLRPGQERIGPNERPLFGCALLVWNRAGDVDPYAIRP